MPDHPPISRRDFFRVAHTYGLSATLLAASTISVGMTLTRLAQATEQITKQRDKKPAKYVLKYGAANHNARILLIVRAGALEFVRDLEARTDGAIRVEFIGDNKICTQLDCVKKTLRGEIDLYTSSTQNAAGIAPYLNVLDFPYMFPSRASQYYFLYHPASQHILRNPLRNRHNLHFLFSHCELRGLFMGLKWQDRPLITQIEELKGTKNRATSSQFGHLAMQLLGLNPLPISIDQTHEALRLGLIDGAETWMSAAAINMAPVISQAVDLRFFCGMEATLMNAEVFDQLETALQRAVMESAYLTQVHIQAANEATLVNTVGATTPPLTDTIFAQHNIRMAGLSDEERAQAERQCSPEFNPKYWERWRERLFHWAGGIDTYAEIHRVAREIPKNRRAENVIPRRWWKAT